MTEQDLYTSRTELTEEEIVQRILDTNTLQEEGHIIVDTTTATTTTTITPNKKKKKKIKNNGYGTTKKLTNLKVFFTISIGIMVGIIVAVLMMQENSRRSSGISSSGDAAKEDDQKPMTIDGDVGASVDEIMIDNEPKTMYGSGVNDDDTKISRESNSDSSDGRGVDDKGDQKPMTIDGDVGASVDEIMIDNEPKTIYGSGVNVDDTKIYKESNSDSSRGDGGEDADNNDIMMGDTMNLQEYINSRLQLGEKYIKLPLGKQYVTPEQEGGRSHLLFKDLIDVTIDGTGTELICTKTTRAISIYNCTNFHLLGLTIDYDPLTFLQGTIVEMSDNKDELTIDVLDGYPDADTAKGNKIEIYSPLDDELVTRTYYGITYAPVIGSHNRTLTVQKKKDAMVEYAYESIGDIIVIGSSNMEGYIPCECEGEDECECDHAIGPENCTNLIVENVVLYASNMFGFFEQGCSNSTYSNNVVDRRSPDTDLQPRAYKRLRSTTADGFHSKFADKGPAFVNCTARYNGDDGIAINGHYHVITLIENDGSNRIRVVGKKGMVPNLMVGDEAELVSYNGTRVPNAQILEFDDTIKVDMDQDEKDFLNDQFFEGNIAVTRNATQVYYVKLDRAVDLPVGSLIASANRVGNGFEVRDCTLGPLRSRGMVVKASDGIITGNTITDTWGQAIMLAPTYGWLESGSGNNLDVSNNIITRSHDAAIAIYAYGGDYSVAPAGAHNGVKITRNLITDSSMPGIVVTSTTDLVMYQNTIQGMNNHYLLPRHKEGNKFGRNGGPERQIYLQNVVKANANSNNIIV